MPACVVCGCVGSAQAAVTVPGTGGERAGGPEPEPGEEAGAGRRGRQCGRRRGHPQRVALIDRRSQRPRLLTEKKLGHRGIKTIEPTTEWINNLIKQIR